MQFGTRVSLVTTLVLPFPVVVPVVDVTCSSQTVFLSRVIFMLPLVVVVVVMAPPLLKTRSDWWVL